MSNSYGERNEYVLIKGRRYRVIHPKRKMKVKGGNQRIALTTAKGNKHLRHSINYITK